ncbi:hypothetical protein A7K95_05460 [Pediococcus parvulus]|uniref:Sugar translocase n=1 Tax=Pediococcus parvulus TaxID=54062 RepID=A0ABX2UGI8_9LACO|nr:oligosaccharide flippase family protein [Pediococcus parvulus]OAD64302.1 hypothetical protein A7K95_05460 [Pediococcus parvulus]
MRSRTSSSIQNIIYSIIGQFISLLVSFVLRIIFVRTLSADYLGVDGLFTSLVSVLSLAELGIGSAINFSLYKPLAEKNIERIKSLMKLYKKAYIFIGFFVFFIGMLFLPFINSISNTNGNVPNLKFLFFLFVVNSSISYFYSYKKSLIIADQYRYLTVIYNYTAFVAMTILQGIFLIFLKNYVVYLLIMILFTFLQNFFISKKADKMYPYLKDKNIASVDSDTKKLITKNAFAMSLHKIGGVVVNSSDSIVISFFSGIKQVGKYSNYLLITNALNLVFGQMFTAVIASIGNLGAEKNKEYVNEVFDMIFFIGYWLVSFSSACLYVLLNPFINLWVGKSYAFGSFTVIIIVLNFYIYQIRRPVLTFRDAMGIYWFDRYVPIIESVLNIGISVVLVQRLGVSGALLGTIISSLLTNVWIEPLMLYRHGLMSNTLNYYRKIIFYTFIAILNITVTKLIGIFIVEQIQNEILSFICLLITTCVVYNLVFVLVFYNNLNFKKAFSLFKRIINLSHRIKL